MDDDTQRNHSSTWVQGMMEGVYGGDGEAPVEHKDCCPVARFTNRPWMCSSIDYDVGSINYNTGWIDYNTGNNDYNAPLALIIKASDL